MQTHTKAAGVIVNNVYDYALDMPYWVVRAVDGKCWFYGAWRDRAEANRVAKEEDGFVVENN